MIDALEPDDPELREAHARADEVWSLPAGALSDVRQLAFEVRHSVLDDLGLVAGVQRLATRPSRALQGLRVEVEQYLAWRETQFPTCEARRSSIRRDHQGSVLSGFQ